MTTPESLREDEFKARMIRKRERQAELAPQLAQVADLGVIVYESLRGKAIHVGSADRDYPLRHQQVHGMSPAGEVGGIVADYLMIGFGDHHGLLIYQDFDPGEGTWKLKRTTRVEGDALITEQSVINQRPPHYQDLYGMYDLEVSRYSYAERIGLNPTHESFSCSFSNEYKDAEQFLADMEADFNRALAEHS